MAKCKSNMQKQFEAHAKNGLRAFAGGGGVDLGNFAENRNIMLEAVKPGGQSFNASQQLQPASIAAPAPVAPPAPPVNTLTTAENASLGKNPFGTAQPTFMGALKDRWGGVSGYAEGGAPKLSLRQAIRSGQQGRVVGPGGPRDDKIPAMLSNGEYVFSKDMVDASGGREALDDFRESIHGKGDHDVMPDQDGLRHFADAGSVIEEGRNLITRPNWIPGGNPPPVAAAAAPEVIVRDPQVWSKEGQAFEAQRMNQGARMGPPMPPGGVAAEAPAAATSAASRAGQVARLGASPTVPGQAGGFTAGGVLAPIAMYSAAQSFQKPTEDYRNRLGMSNDDPSLIGDLGARAAGVISDFGARAIDTATGPINAFADIAGLKGRIPSAYDNLAANDNAAPNPSLRTTSAAQTVKPSGEFVGPGQQSPAAVQPTLRGDPTAPMVRSSHTIGAQDIEGFSNTMPSTFEPGRSANFNGRTVTIKGDTPSPEWAAQANANAQGGMRDRVMQARGRAEDPEYQAARAAYNAGSVTPSLRRDPSASDRPYGKTEEGTWSDQWNQNAERRDRNIQKGIDLRDRESLRSMDSAAAGRDVTMRGQDMTARSAAASARADQMNKDRAYNMDVAKYGTEVAEKNQKARAASDEAMQKNLESRFRTKNEKGESVVDHDKIASFRTAVDTTIPQLITQLESSANPQARAKAAELRARGASALEPSDMDQLQQLHGIRERMRQSKGFGPNAGTFQESDNLMDYRQTGVAKRTFGGNRIVTPAGEVSYNDLRYKDGPSNRILWDILNTEDKNLTRGLRRE